MTASLDVVVHRVRPDFFGLGIDVAVAAKRATGIPLDVDEDTLRSALARRQEGASGVWLALSGTTTVGHALVAIVSNSHDTWGRVTDPLIAEARKAGRLLELGGLSVHPDHTRQGIARRLQRARLNFAHDHGYVPVAAAWDASPGSTRLCARAGRVVGVHHEHPITLFHLDEQHTATSR